MLKVNEHTVRSIVKRLLEEANAAASGPSKIDLQYHEGVFSTVNEAVQSATRALPLLREMKIANREALIRDLRAAVIRERDDPAVRIHNETGLGRIEDKIAKITLAAEKTPGTEDLAVRAVSGDSGLSLIEHAPYGVIASILPVTNPAETIINNAISMTAGGNAVVFNPHPSAQKVSAHVIGILNAEGKKHTGCPNIFSCISETSLDSARELMRHPLTDLLVVTGGPAVVKEALQSGKRVIAAGPGNPPVLVDESADAVQAARDIVFGASFDNNIICCE
ncbi:MAG TPA: aldehyde dehydrogenase EutE, partial [Spirochaetia bacterium]|nr:aldehyde dehydrogenase EutE [Spirochaetia bacterium]